METAAETATRPPPTRQKRSGSIYVGEVSGAATPKPSGPADPTVRQAIEAFLEETGDSSHSLVMVMLGSHLGPAARLRALTLEPDEMAHFVQRTWGGGDNRDDAVNALQAAFGHWRERGWEVKEGLPMPPYPRSTVSAMADSPDRPTDHESRSSFWEGVHDSKDVDDVSWWQSVPRLSLGLVDATDLALDDPVIDVGAGWSTLVDHLVERGYQDVSAVDLSSTALQTIRDRLGDNGKNVVLQIADVLDLDMGRTYALWHDRAVYHFLTEADERADYVASLERSLRPNGWLVVATFGPDGPTHCSGLPIVRYTHQELAAQFPGFDLVDTAVEDHETPWGTTQQFTAVLMRRRR